MDQLLHAAQDQRVAGLPPPPRIADVNTVPPPSGEPPPVPLPSAAPPAALPIRRPARDYEPLDRQPRRPRPERLRDLPEDDEGEADYFETAPKGRGYSKKYLVGCSRAGLILSLISLAGILVGLFVYLNAVRRGDGLGTVGLYLVLSVVGFVAFTLALLGVIFSGRGLDPTNEHNRGVAVGGLVCGILGLCVSAIAGSFTLFCGVLLHLMRL